MIYKVIFTLIIGLGLATFARCQNNQSTDNPDILKNLVVEYFNGVSGKSLEKLMSVTTDDFVIYEGGKVWNNDSVFKNIRYHQPFTAKFTLTNFKINMDTHSGDATYLSHVDFVFVDTIKVAIDFIEGATFRKTPLGWRINFLHATLRQPAVVDMPAPLMHYDTVRFIKDHYKERLKLFNSEPLTKGSTIVLGNSITEFADCKSLTGDPTAINRGIAGDNTFGILDRLDEVVARQPKKLYIEAGINDLAQNVPVELIAENIDAIIQIAKAKCAGVKIYVISVLPTNEDAKKEYPEVYGKNALAEKLNMLLQQNAGKQGFTYIDLASKVKDSQGNLDRKYALEDGLHPNKAGYAVLANLLKQLP